MSQPSPSTGTTVSLPRIPAGKDLYDEIMGKIEPELLGANVGRLKEKYKNETAAQSLERAKRYAAAFKAYDAAFAEYVTSLKRSIHDFAHTAAQSLENLDRDLDTSDLTDLEQQMNI